MNNRENIFTAADEPLTTTEIAARLNEPSRRVRSCYYTLLKKMPDHPNIKPLYSEGRTRLLSAATANKIASILAPKK